MKLKAILSITIGTIMLIGCSGPSHTVSKLMEDNAVATRYTDKEVTLDDVERLVDAGQSVPSTRNVSQWQFIAVGSDKIPALAGIKTLGEGVANARAAIVVCGLTRRMNEGDARDLWQQDCAAATQNILLAARAKGMTPNWVRVFPMQQRVRDVVAALNLDPGTIPFAVIALGYADADNQKVEVPAKQPDLKVIGSLPD